MVTSFLNRFAPIDFTRYIDRLTDRFTGREWLFEKHIEPWLKNNDNEQFYLLTGEPGVGKSAIVAELIKRWQTQLGDEEQGKLAAYHFCRAGDVETVRPGRVLRSIAAQLGKTLPHYGKALNKVLEQVHLKIDVKINIDTLSNSQVTGIYIENLKELDPREELRLLIQAPLAKLPEIYKDLPEEERAKLPAIPTLKVFLIDSLDEAVTTTGRDNVATLLAALSQANDLPPWIRFILTARPEILRARLGSDTALQFQSLKHYELEKLLAENLTDIEQYVTRRVRETLDQPEAKFQARLEEAQLSAEALVQEVRDLSKGNFLYTRLVMDGISTGELSLKNLSALPKNLYEVYQRFLRHRCPVRKWINLYQPILGTLTVTQEAISSVQLAKFAKVTSDQVEGVPQVGSAIAILQQFLDEVENDEGQKLYTIFHQSLREYLLDRKHNHDFWCDAKEHHDNIIECCKGESKDWEDLRAIDLYGVRHLAQHLVKGDRVEELHSLLRLEKDDKNAWFKVKDEVEDTAGFLADVTLAWELAEQNWTEATLPQVIEKQCLYALILSSLNSLADIPTEFLKGLVKVGLPYGWLPEKGLAYARRIPDPAKRAKNLEVLIEYLPEEQQAKIWREALSAAKAVQNEYYRAEALIALATNLPELYQEALSAAQAIYDEQSRADALVALAANLPEELYKDALSAAQAIQNEYYRAKALIALAARVPEALYKEALSAAQAFQEQFYSDQVLIALAANVPEELYQEALSAAQAIQYDTGRADALFALASNFPEAYKEALSAAQAIHLESKRVNTLIALASNFPEAYKEALSAVQAIQEEFDRADALNNLIPQSATFPISQQFTIWQEILHQESQRKRPEFLSDLAALVPLIDSLGSKAAGIGIAKAIQQVFKWWQ